MSIHLGASFDYVLTLEAIFLNLQVRVTFKLTWVIACYHLNSHTPNETMCFEPNLQILAFD